MEQGDRLKVIQRGGSGWELQIHSQIREENDDFFDALLMDIVKDSSQTDFEGEVKETERD